MSSKNYDKYVRIPNNIERKKTFPNLNYIHYELVINIIKKYKKHDSILDVGAGYSKFLKSYMAMGFRNAIMLEPSLSFYTTGNENLNRLKQLNKSKYKSIHNIRSVGELLWSDGSSGLDSKAKDLMIKHFGKLQKFGIITFNFSFHYLLEKNTKIYNNINNHTKVGSRVIIFTIDGDYINQYLSNNDIYSVKNKDEIFRITKINNNQIKVFLANTQGLFDESGITEYLVLRNDLVNNMSNIGFDLVYDRNMTKINKNISRRLTDYEYKISKVYKCYVFEKSPTNKSINGKILSLLKIDNINKLFLKKKSNFKYLNSLNVDNIDPNKSIVTLKLDGEHKYLYFDTDKAYLFDLKDSNEYDHQASNTFKHSLFEVELIGKTIYIINIIYLFGKSTDSLTNYDIHEMLNVKLFDYINDITLSNNIRVKRFKSVTHYDPKEIKKISKSTIPNDGLLIMRRDDRNYTGNIYKWKSKEHLTIDFMTYLVEKDGELHIILMTIKPNKGIVKDMQVLSHLKKFDFKRLNMIPHDTGYSIIIKKYTKDIISSYKNINFKTPTNLYKFTQYELFNGSIVECIFKNNKFKLVTQRDHKTYVNFSQLVRQNVFNGPNSTKTYDSIMDTMKNNLTIPKFISTMDKRIK
jgi:hypothetical protein